MAKQQPNPEAGVRQSDKPERPVENFEEDLAAGDRKKAKSGDKEDRAVADAVSDLDGKD